MQNLNHLEQSRLERLRRAARVGEIVFTKHGVYETHQCDYCCMHHKVPPSLLSQTHCPAFTCKNAWGKKYNQTQSNPDSLNPDSLPPRRRLLEDTMHDIGCRNMAHNTVFPSLGKSVLLNKDTRSAPTDTHFNNLEYSSLDNSHGQAISHNFSPIPPTTPCPRTTSAAKSRHDRLLKRSLAKSNMDTEELAEEHGHDTFRQQNHHTQHNNHHTQHNNHHNRKTDRTYSSQAKDMVQCPSCSTWICFQAETDADLERSIKREIFLQEEDTLKQNLIRERERYKQAMQ